MSVKKDHVLSQPTLRTTTRAGEQNKVKPEDIPPAQEDSRVEESDNKDGLKPQSKARPQPGRHLG
ncbi:hypothetical protein [Pseudomonas baetica]|uniref:hypothetical protein n=1 Tax=Pseudomonas baetica TaxID=674054 RepID=UPI0011B2778A|nr:hypothetical protein [Pseudomonas baetica]MDR9861894.1 hypothetical protein [Pseudomonas baetica]